MAVGKSYTQRTLERLRDSGWMVEVVERWNPYAHIRQDLFGIVDILALKPGMIMGVQSTSGGCHTEHVKKAKVEPRLKMWLMAGGLFEVWSWKKVSELGGRPKWVLRRQLLTLHEMEV